MQLNELIESNKGLNKYPCFIPIYVSHVDKKLYIRNTKIRDLKGIDCINNLDILSDCFFFVDLKWSGVVKGVLVITCLVSSNLNLYNRIK